MSRPTDTSSTWNLPTSSDTTGIPGSDDKVDERTSDTTEETGGPVHLPSPLKHPPPTPPLQLYPRVGVGVVVISPFPATTTDTTITTGTTTAATSNGIWVGRRRGSHGSQTMALPGGHLEMYESWSECAVREVQEEMGITLSRVELLHVTNDIMIEEQKHYITIFMVGHYDSNTWGVPMNCEPHKCDGWELVTLPQLQNMIGTKELFIPLEHLLQDNPPALLQKYLGHA